MSLGLQQHRYFLDDLTFVKREEVINTNTWDADFKNTQVKEIESCVTHNREFIVVECTLRKRTHFATCVARKQACQDNVRREDAHLTRILSYRIYSNDLHR